MLHALPNQFLVDVEARIAAELVRAGRSLTRDRTHLSSLNFVQLAALRKGLVDAPWSAVEAERLQQTDITLEEMIDEAAELVLLEYLEDGAGAASEKICTIAQNTKKFPGRKGAAQQAYDTFIQELRPSLAKIDEVADFLNLTSGVTAGAIVLPSGKSAGPSIDQRFVEAQAVNWRYVSRLLGNVRQDLLQMIQRGDARNVEPAMIGDPIIQFWESVDRRDRLHYESSEEALRDASTAAEMMRDRLDASSVDFVLELREQILSTVADDLAFADLRFVYEHGQLSRPLAAVVEQTLLSSTEPIIDGHTFGAPLGELLETPNGRARICKLAGVKPTELQAAATAYADQYERPTLHITPSHFTPKAPDASAEVPATPTPAPAQQAFHTL